MGEIEICDMRGAGKPDYVAKIDDRREKHFLVATKYTNHGTSAKKVTYTITEDGIYEVCDANFGGRKRKVTYILVENDKAIFESESLQEAERQRDHLDGKIESWVIAPEEPMITDRTIDLPQLQGSEKQISWAEDIRSKLLEYCKKNDKDISAWIFNQTSAKFYIDNRDKFGSALK